MVGPKQSQHRIFYGWWIVGALFLISGYIFGFTFYSFTAIIEPIAREFNWNYTTISFASSLQGVETGLLAPLVGYLIDRWRARKLVIAGIISAGLGLILLSKISSLFMFYISFVLISIGLTACGGVLTMTVVGNWFRRNISLATGITLSGTAIGGLLVMVMTHLITTLGWRTAMMIIGLGAWCILLPLTPIIKHRPEDYGIMPDGDKELTSDPTSGIKSTISMETEIGVVQALKSRAFWHIAFGFMCHVMLCLSILTHVMPYLSSIGIPRSYSSMVAGAIPVISVFGRLSFGWFGDRYPKKKVVATGFAMTAIGSLLLNTTSIAGAWLLIPFVIILGIGFGGPIPMQAALIREYFGRARLGTIIGMSMGVMMIGNIMGPPTAGMIYDLFSSYQGAWLTFAGIAFVGMLSMLTTPSVSTTINHIKG